MIWTPSKLAPSCPAGVALASSLRCLQSLVFALAQSHIQVCNQRAQPHPESLAKRPRAASLLQAAPTASPGTISLRGPSQRAACRSSCNKQLINRYYKRMIWITSYRDICGHVLKYVYEHMCTYARGYRRTYVLIYVHINVPIMLYVPMDAHIWGHM